MNKFMNFLLSYHEQINFIVMDLLQLGATGNVVTPLPLLSYTHISVLNHKSDIWNPHHHDKSPQVHS